MRWNYTEEVTNTVVKGDLAMTHGGRGIWLTSLNAGRRVGRRRVPHRQHQTAVQKGRLVWGGPGGGLWREAVGGNVGNW